MRIRVLYFEGCPNHGGTVALLNDVLREQDVAAEIEEVEVAPEDVDVLRFLGSPTVQIDGVDIEPAARDRTDFAYGCRFYGGSGMPSHELIRSALNGTIATSRPINGTARIKGKAPATLMASTGSIIAAVVGTACCWLPPLLLVFGVSATGIASSFASLRPWFLTGAFAFLGLGFFVAYRRKPCCEKGVECAATQHIVGRLNRFMLWTALVIVLAMTFFPSYFVSIVGDGTAELSGDAPIMAISIEGMDCEACATNIQKTLLDVPGVTAASVSYENGIAEINFDELSPPNEDSLTDAVGRAGFRATVKKTK